MFQRRAWDYTANTKAWMTGDLFEDILRKWNRQFSQEECYIILLIVDNCPPSHNTGHSPALPSGSCHQIPPPTM